MPLIKLDSAMVTHLQARVAALAELHRDISTLIEAIDLPLYYTRQIVSMTACASCTRG